MSDEELRGRYASAACHQKHFQHFFKRIIVDVGKFCDIILDVARIDEDAGPLHCLVVRFFQRR